MMATMELPDLEVSSLKLPPHSLESESSVIGALLLDNDMFDLLSDAISASDFYKYEHRLIFGAISQLIAAGKPADVVTVFEHLEGQHKAQEAGGLTYLNALAQFVPNKSNIRRYAEVVRERSVLRKLVATGDMISVSAMNPDGRTLDEVIDQAEQAVFKIGQEGNQSKPRLQVMSTLALELMARVEKAADNPNDVTGVRTGYIEFDRMTAGLQPGDLIILAARPSMGKTSLAINIAEHIALNEGMPVLVFSMEMGASQLATRIVGSIGRIDQGHLRTGKLRDEEWGRLTEAIEKLRDMPLHIDETGMLTPSDLRSTARRLARDCKQLGLIVVDYLQLMSGTQHDRGSDNRASELGEITRALKLLAKELKCPIIALSQLNRKVEERTDKRPMMSDLRDSGSLEQDADLVLFIYRDEYYTKEACKEPGVAEIIIAKHRNGPTGPIKLAFLSQLTRFENLAYSGSGDM
jgi:replicative DNA helicase